MSNHCRDPCTRRGPKVCERSSEHPKNVFTGWKVSGPRVAHEWPTSGPRLTTKWSQKNVLDTPCRVKKCLFYPTLKNGPRVAHKWAVGHSPVSVFYDFFLEPPASPDGSRPPKVDGPPWQTFSFGNPIVFQILPGGCQKASREG